MGSDHEHAIGAEIHVARRVGQLDVMKLFFLLTLPEE